MAQIHHVDMEEYATEALELLGEEKDGFVRHALSWLSDGHGQEDTRKRLVRRVKSDMEDVLFEHLKRTGAVRGDYRIDYTRGYYYRRKYVEPRLSDVPSRLVNIETIIPNFQEAVDSMMTEARRLKAVADIEATTREAGIEFRGNPDD